MYKERTAGNGRMMSKCLAKNTEVTGATLGMWALLFQGGKLTCFWKAFRKTSFCQA